MTLQQLKYVVTTADAGTVSEAAKRLYIAQPSLTASIKELEHELGITIFQKSTSLPAFMKRQNTFRLTGCLSARSAALPPAKSATSSSMPTSGTSWHSSRKLPRKFGADFSVFYAGSQVF